MAANALKNEWHHRKVAEAQAKSCWICFKPSTSVLITPDSKDFFYVCPGHLKDRGFAIPDADEAAAVEDKRKKEELDREIEKVKREYMDRQEEKAKKRKEKKKKDKKEEEKDKKAEEDEDKKDEKDRDEKIKSLEDKAPVTTENAPRIFNLHKNFYQMRLDRLKNIEQAKRNQQRLKDPMTFPSVPKGDL